MVAAHTGRSASRIDAGVDARRCLRRWWNLVTGWQRVGIERALVLRGWWEVVDVLGLPAERSGRRGASFSRWRPITNC
jgi:hypothetical protein